MFQSNVVNYSKLKTNLRLAVNRLRLLEKKKTEVAQKAKKEIADFVSIGKYERAKIRVEQIIREDYLVEALELLEMYCDTLLSRFGMLQQSREADACLLEAVSGLLWASSRIEADVPELKVIRDQLTRKYGKRFIETCQGGNENVAEKLKQKMAVEPPPKVLVEKYLVEISKNYGVAYEPDPQVMSEYERRKGIDSMLFADNVDTMPVDLRPTGFIGFSSPPLFPQDDSRMLQKQQPQPTAPQPKPSAEVPGLTAAEVKSLSELTAALPTIPSELLVDNDTDVPDGADNSAGSGSLTFEELTRKFNELRRNNNVDN